MLFHDNLRYYREQAGFTAKELAAIIGLKYSTYAAYENQGREPKYETLCKIADTLHITTDTLLGHQPDAFLWAKHILELNGFKFFDRKTTEDKAFLRYKSAYYEDFLIGVLLQKSEIIDMVNQAMRETKGIHAKLLRSSLGRIFIEYYHRTYERSSDHE